jgi:predicted DNA-binding transcriptional regulator AlpA
MDELKTLRVEQLAEILGKTPGSIMNDLGRAPHRLPPPLRIPGVHRVLWREVDVKAWLQRHVAPVATLPAVAQDQDRPRRGRPTKAAMLAGVQVGVGQ